MIKELSEQFKPVRWGLLFSILTLIYGFGLGITFGVAEDNIKKNLKEKAQTVSEKYYQKKEDMDKVLKKSWTYFKRSHLHAGGLGAGSLGLIILLALIYSGSGLFKTLVSIGVGFGGLGYSVSWMIAGLNSPGLGSTSAGKHSIFWLSGPSAIFCLAGVLVILGLFIYSQFIKKPVS